VDYWQRERARRELEAERRARNRDNAQAAAINAQSQAMAKASAAARRAGAGSRFNIWYPGSLPSGAATPRGIVEALAPFAAFGDGFDRGPEPLTGRGPSGPSLRRGMTIEQVEQILGPAERVGSAREGSLEVVVREYSREGREKVSTKFAGGVLIDYAVVPQ
jgi:hypothetical protein